MECTLISTAQRTATRESPEFNDPWSTKVQVEELRAELFGEREDEVENEALEGTNEALGGTNAKQTD
jgi:hypothetical protein